MKTIEEAAKAYATTKIKCEHSPLNGIKVIENAKVKPFIDGAKWALDHQWYKIERDKDGFATEECLDRIFEDSIILFHDNRDDEIEVYDGFDDWRRDIKRHAYYDFWMPIPKINK